MYLWLLIAIFVAIGIYRIYPNNHYKFGDIIELLGYNTYIYNYGYISTHNWNYQGPSRGEVVNAAESQFLAFH
jgi:hypothetical protein